MVSILCSTLTTFNNNIHFTHMQVSTAHLLDSITLVYKNFSNCLWLTSSHPYLILLNPILDTLPPIYLQQRYMSFTQVWSDLNIDNHFSKGKQNHCLYSVSSSAKCKLIALFISDFLCSCRRAAIAVSRLGQKGATSRLIPAWDAGICLSHDSSSG